MTTEYRNKKTSDRANQNERYNQHRQADEDDEEEDVREYYTSNDKLVRNGVYGAVYPYNNGSAETSQLFKVIDATGRCDSSGIRLKNKKFNKSSNVVYYNSPSEYMDHRKVKLHQSVIKGWDERIQEMERRQDNMDDVK